MTYEYVVERADGAEVRLARTAMLLRWGRFAFQSAQVRLRRRGGEYGAWMSPLKALGEVRHVTAIDRAGVRILTQRKDAKELIITKVTAAPDLGAAPALEAIHHAVWTRYANRVRSGGLWFCRYVDGTQVVSRHGYQTDAWKGAAEDIFVTDPNTMAFLFEVAAFIVESGRLGRLKPRDVICGDKRWRASNAYLEEPYRGAYHRHIHVDVDGGEPCTP